MSPRTSSSRLPASRRARRQAMLPAEPGVRPVVQADAGAAVGVAKSRADVNVGDAAANRLAVDLAGAGRWSGADVDRIVGIAGVAGPAIVRPLAAFAAAARSRGAD